MFLWYAVNGNGHGHVFVDRPVRDERWKMWLGHIEGCVYQVVSLMESCGVSIPPMRWEDEPLCLSLTLTLEQ